MWGYSFEDLARRAQEEAAKLAEQASSTIASPGLFSLDDLNPDKEQTSKKSSSTTNTTTTTTTTRTTSANNTIHYSNDHRHGLFATPGGVGGGGGTVKFSSASSSTAPAAAPPASTSLLAPQFFTDRAPRNINALASKGNDDSESNIIKSRSNSDNNNTTDHIASFVSKDCNYSPNQQKLRPAKNTTTTSIAESVTPTTLLPSVKKLQITLEEKDEFNFDSWGEEENYEQKNDNEADDMNSGIVQISDAINTTTPINEGSSELFGKPPAMAQERLDVAEKETSKVELDDRKARMETERLQEERLAATAVEAEQQEQERRAAEAKKNRLEQNRLVAEDEAKEKARGEAERIEKERLAAEAKKEMTRVETEQVEEEWGAAEEDEVARFEAERVEQERPAAGEEESRIEIERKEKETLVAEENEKARVEAEQIEQGRLAAEDAEAKILTFEREWIASSEEETEIEAERIEQMRLAAEEEKARVEAERLVAEEKEKARLLAVRIDQERLAAEEEKVRLEAERIEQERLEAEAEKVRIEAEQIEQERLGAGAEKVRIEAEQIEQERLAVAGEKARVEAERMEQERLAVEEEKARVEAERMEQERLAEEEEKARIEAERIEQERLAEEEEKARVEAERMEQDRLAAEEEKARIEAERIEEERLAAQEKARIEAERQDLEEETSNFEAERKEQERLAVNEQEEARLLVVRIEQDRISLNEAEARVETEQMEQETMALEEEKARVEAERFELEIVTGEKYTMLRAEQLEQEAKLDSMAVKIDVQRKQESMTDEGKVKNQTSSVHESEGDDDMDELYDDEELDDMYDDEDDNDDNVHPEPEKVLDEELVEEIALTRDQSSGAIEASAVAEPGRLVDEPPLSSGSSLTDNSFLTAAAAATSTSMQSMFDSSKIFEASKTAALFSWGYGGSSDNFVEQSNDSAEKNALDSIAETGSCHKAEVPSQSNVCNNAVNSSPIEQEVVASVITSVSQQCEPPNMLDNFVKQLQRMTESHQLEMDELQRTHKIEIDQLQSELFSERDMKKKVKARDEVASQDKYLKQMRELEKKFNDVLKVKEEELRDAIERNEGMGLQMDTLKREVSGLAKIVDERDDEICRLKQGHGNTMMQVESGRDEMARKENEINELRTSAASLQTELRSTTDAYNTLKARAKAVATELKDRRIEVRNLSSQVEELESSNASFEMQLSNLRSAIKQNELTLGYKDKDIELLNEKITELKKQITKENDKSMQDRSVGEKAIASYKRKAQEALAAANSRLAAANQAREEAESDAKNAKSASDDAVERARVAEMKKLDAEKRLADVAGQLKSERMVAAKSLDELKDTIKSLEGTVESLQIQLKDATSKNEKFSAELERLNSNLADCEDKNSDLREQLIESNTRCESLQREVFDLTDEVQRSSAAAFKRAKDNGDVSIKTGHIVSGNDSNMSLSGSAVTRGESDGTIIMLQHELQGANEAIAELKLALRTALLENANNVETRDGLIPGREAGATHNKYRHEDGEFTSRNESTPLYFAIEKQNELKTARDEINRLANMVGEAESAKQDAYDAMEEMRQKMEEATSRLLRYEKLGLKSTARPQITHSAYGPPFRNPPSSLANDSAVNLEYLKNVMLSFLTAKTLAERRKLVPVVATVLCLTPEEQTQAINSVEQTAGLTGVASSFWENLESKAHSLM